MSKQKLLLHIGCAKTGTTTLQWVLKHGREALAKAGFAYADTGLSESPHEFGHHGLVAAATHKKDSWATLLKEIGKSGGKDVIVSSENFSLLTPDAIRFVKEQLDGIEITLIVYLREQADFAGALYNQAIKTGLETSTRDDFLVKFIENGRGNYLRLIETWNENLQPAKLIVRIYQKTALLNGDIVDDFCSLLNVDSSALKRPPAQLNESVNNCYLEFLRHVNSLGVPVQEKNAKIVSPILRFQTETRAPNLPIFNRHQRWMIRNQYKQANQLILKRFAPGNATGKQLFSIVEQGADICEPEGLRVETLASILVGALLHSK